METVAKSPIKLFCNNFGLFVLKVVFLEVVFADPPLKNFFAAVFYSRYFSSLEKIFKDEHFSASKIISSCSRKSVKKENMHDRIFFQTCMEDSLIINRIYFFCIIRHRLLQLCL